MRWKHGPKTVCACPHLKNNPPTYTASALIWAKEHRLSHPPLTCRAVAVTALLCSGSAFSQSLVSMDGSAFQPGALPLTVVQSAQSNQAATLERESRADTLIDQAGHYNRAVQIQTGGDKYSILKQHGRYNRALVVQVGGSSTDIQDSQTQQTGDGAVNSLYVFQTSANPADWNAAEAAWARLNLEQAQTVAHNFMYGPEIARAKVGIAEDVAQLFVDTLSVQQDQDRFATGEAAKIPVFVAASYGDASRESTLGALGYHQSIRSLTVGTRHRLGERTRLGWAFNISNADAGMQQDMGSIRTQAYQVAGFGSYIQGPYHLDWALSYGHFDFDTGRYDQAMRVESDSKGSAYTARVQGAYWLQSANGAMRWGPYVAATYKHSSSDAYSEQGHLLLAQDIDKQQRRRLSSALGAAWHFHSKREAGNFSAYVKAEWVYDAGMNQADETDSRFAMDRTVRVITPLQDGSSDRYGVITAGVKYPLRPGLDVVVAAQKTLGSDVIKRTNGYLGLAWAL